MRARLLISLGLFVGCLPAVACGDEWPQFRGPDGSATNSGKQLTQEWGTEKNVVWKVKVPGYSWSSPIVWGDKVFLTTAITDKQQKPKGGFAGFGSAKPDTVYKFEVHCLDRITGKTLWKQTAAERKPAIASYNKVYASETPATDGERVYAYFGMHGLYCYDINGAPVWQKDLGSYPMAMGFGTGSSPVLADGRLFVQCDNDAKSFLLALEAKTGRDLWKVERPGKSSWSTPLVWKTKQRTELVTCGEGRVTSHNLETGKVLWEMRGSKLGGAATPAADAERIYFGTGGPYGDGRLYAVMAGATGDVTGKPGETSSAWVAWIQTRSAPFVASPLAYRGNVYVLQGDSNILTCLDAKSGKQLYKERLPGARGFTSSPWACNGKVFCLDENGTTYVIQAGADFKVLGKNTLAEMCWSSPAVSAGALFLRTVDQLYCIKQENGLKLPRAGGAE